jgi:hypothetical protein
MQTESDALFTIFGASLCLGGWIVFYMGSRLVGVALGAALGFVFGTAVGIVLKLPESPSMLIQLSCGLLGGFGGLVFMKAATSFLFGLTGFLFGLMLGRLGSEVYFEIRKMGFAFTNEVILAIVASGTIVGLLAVWMQKYIMILVTSFIGASFLSESVGFLKQHQPLSDAVLIVVAIFWQLLLVNWLLAPDKPEVMRGAAAGAESDM